MIPDIAFEIMPAFGFLLCASGFGYVSLMYNECKGAYAMIYGNFLLGNKLIFSQSILFFFYLLKVNFIIIAGVFSTI